MKTKLLDEVCKDKTNISPELFEEVEFEEYQAVNFKDFSLKIGPLELSAKKLSCTSGLVIGVVIIFLIGTLIMTLVPVYLS